MLYWWITWRTSFGALLSSFGKMANTSENGNSSEAAFVVRPSIFTLYQSLYGHSFDNIAVTTYCVSYANAHSLGYHVYCSLWSHYNHLLIVWLGWLQHSCWDWTISTSGQYTWSAHQQPLPMLFSLEYLMTLWRIEMLAKLYNLTLILTPTI